MPAKKTHALGLTQSIKGIEVFRVGKWNGTEFTQADIDGMAQAFRETRTAVMPFLKLGHNDEQDLLRRDDLPAAGWVDDLRVEGDRLVADFSGIPSKIYDLLQRGAYRTRSIEIWRNVNIAGKSYPWLLTAVALLGAELPAVEGLNDILSLFAAQGGEAMRFEAGGEPLVFDLGNTKQTEDNTMTDEQKKALADAETAKVEAVKQAETFKTENEALKAKVATLETEKATAIETATAALAEVGEFKRKANEAEINTAIDDLVKNKKISPAQKPALFAMLCVAGSQNEMKFSIGEKKDLSLKDALLEFVSNGSGVTLPTEPQSKGGDHKKPNAAADDLRTEAIKHVEKMKAEGKTVSYRDALLHVGKAHDANKGGDAAE